MKTGLKRLLMLKAMTGKADDGNLISLSWPQGYADPNTSSASTKRTFTPNTYIVGLSYNNTYRSNYATQITDFSVSEEGITFTSGTATNYGIGFVMKECSPGATYEMNFDGHSTGNARISWYAEDGAFISYSDSTNSTKQVTAPANAATAIFCTYSAATNTTYTYTDVKVTKVQS